MERLNKEMKQNGKQSIDENSKIDGNHSINENSKEHSRKQKKRETKATS